MTKSAHEEPELTRLQVYIRKSTMESLKAEAAAEIIPVAVLVRRILDEHVAHLGDVADAEGGVR